MTLNVAGEAADKVVEIALETGRHYQIRVQFASRGHSLYGDQKYGKGPKDTQIALWAYKLEFKHPVKDEIMTFECRPKPIGVWEKFEIWIVGGRILCDPRYFYISITFPFKYSSGAYASSNISL